MRILIILILFIIVHSKAKENYNVINNVCQSKRCLRSAAHFLIAMNSTEDPCNDFYSYACGNWHNYHKNSDPLKSNSPVEEKQIKINKLIGDILRKNSTNADPIPLVQARDMYKACMDTAKIKSHGIEHIISFLQFVDLEPIPMVFNLTKGYSEHTCKLNWIEKISNIKKRSDIDVLFKFDIKSGSFNTKLLRSNFKIPPRSKFISRIVDDASVKINGQTLLQKYISLMKIAIKDIMKYTPENLKLNISDRTIDIRIDRVLNEYINISRKIDNILKMKSGKNLVKYDTAFVLQSKTNNELKRLNLSLVDVWQPYVLHIFNNTNIKINFDSDLIRATTDNTILLNQLISIVQNTTCARMEIFIWFQVIENLIQYSHLQNEFDSKFLNSKTINRTKHCIDCTIQHMGMAIAYDYVKITHSKSTMETTKIMLNNIINEFKISLRSSNWIDNTTKTKAIEKIDAMKIILGFPDWLLDSQKLNAYYEGLTVYSDRHMSNVFNNFRIKFQKKLNAFRLPYNKYYNSSNPLYLPMEINAYTLLGSNTIVITYAWMQHPNYNVGLQSLNYGTLGITLGHELAHGILNSGRFYDKNGNQYKWWSPSSVDNLENNSECLIQQFSNYTYPETKIYINGTLTLNENISDNVGLKSAFKAYKKATNGSEKLPGLEHLNGDQLFFLTYANKWCRTLTSSWIQSWLKNSHSPDFARVNGNFRNSPEFIEAWKCKLGSGMNPARKRCVIL